MPTWYRRPILNGFLSAPSLLLRCRACDCSTHVLRSAPRPERCPRCELASTDADTTDATPEGALAAGVTRVG